MEYEFTTVRDIYRDRKKYIGSPITVGGWIRSIRSSSKSFGFMVISDGSYFETLQIVFDKDKIDNFDEVSRLNGGSSVIVTGELVETPQAKLRLQVNPRRIIRCRKNATRWNFCAPCRIFVRAPTRSRLCSAYVRWLRMLFINSSRSVTLCMCTRR